MGDNKYKVAITLASVALGVGILNHLMPKEKIIREVHYTEGIDTVKVYETISEEITIERIVQSKDLNNFDLASKQMAFWRRAFTLDSSRSMVYDRNTYFVYTTTDVDSADDLAKRLAKGLERKGNQVSVRLTRQDPDSGEVVLATKYGLKQFMEGAIGESFKYPFIADSLKAYNLNPNLKWLPVLESRYLNESKSSVNAKGLWQFMEGTGKKYGLIIKGDVDERLDPKKATSAFCKYMTLLNKDLGAEALAVTAYNHGENGIRRKLEEVKGNSLAEIKHLMGFASSNFYAEFLAVVDVAENHKQYGLNVNIKEVIEIIPKAEDVIEIKKDSLKLEKELPKPKQESITISKPKVEAEIMSADDVEEPAVDTSKNFYIVQSGDNLSYIGKQFNISWVTLKEFNKMTSPALKPKDTVWIPKDL